MKAIDGLGKSRNTPIDLGANQVISIQGRRGTSILCVRGHLWVTQEGDRRDYILPRGLRFVAAGAGRIVVHGAADHNRIEVGYVELPRTSVWPPQALQIDMQCFAQIESEARRARTAYFATALDASAVLWGHAWRRVRRWLAGSITAARCHKPRGSV